MATQEAIPFKSFKHYCRPSSTDKLQFFTERVINGRNKSAL